MIKNIFTFIICALFLIIVFNYLMPSKYNKIFKPKNTVTFNKVAEYISGYDFNIDSLNRIKHETQIKLKHLIIKALNFSEKNRNFKQISDILKKIYTNKYLLFIRNILTADFFI